MNEIIIKSFISKRNKVQLVEVDGTLMVKKAFEKEKDCKKEIQELNMLAALNVPKIIHCTKNCIYMTYIEGKLLLDLLLSSTKKDMPFLARLLAQFLKEYHSVTQNRIIDDLNFRNFIVVEDILYGVDFENTKIGQLEECIAKAVAFVLFYEISDEKKEIFIMSMLEEVNFSKKDIMTYLTKEIDFLAERRNVSKPSICF